MINLINPAESKELKAARVNVRLRRLVILTFFALSAVGAMYAVSFKIVENERSDAIKQSAVADVKLKEYEATKATAKAYQSNLSIAKKVLGSEITFSTFITNLSTSLPPSTILQSFSISTGSIGAVKGKPTSVQLLARAKSYADAVALKTNLEKKTDLFSEVRIASVTLQETKDDDPIVMAYPYAVTLSVILAQQGATK